MPRRKKQGVRRHLFICPYIWPGEDPRRDKVLAWYDSLESRKRTAIVMDLLAAALLGELGPQVQSAVEMGSQEEAVDALRDLLSVFEH